MTRDPWTDVGDSAAYLAPRAQGRPDAWTEELAQTRRSGSQRLIKVAELVPPSEVADALGLSSADHVVVRRRVMLIDDRPVELADSYYPARLASGTLLGEMRKIPGGAPTLLAELGYRPKEALEELTVRPATEREAEGLALTPGSLVVVLFRIVVGVDGVPFEVSVMTMRPEGRRFRYRVKVG
ncbi:GntR family transcriptional regulator [Sphaerisporangium krabiense]|uniref:DNA-binding GntR family transcriptional regulator n=1 Tax=Sphaerisporangium krabiense TaxID=763782 RepID=A0A7W8Z0C8_9ACTN|nr:UTRA domain-containing protein [Sphaerisporangium krabiense]MBB5625055.1 DNA-binding GntR family transcriptional regulator [Sphaerisporangium krabiense]